MSTGQRFALIAFAMIVGGCGAVAFGQLWQWIQPGDTAGEAGIAREFTLFFWIAPTAAIGCGILVAYLTRDRKDP